MEHLRCYTLSFDAVRERFDMSLLDKELVGQVITVEDVSVFSFDGLPRLNVLVRVRDPTESAKSMAGGVRAGRAATAPRTLEQWRGRLRPNERRLFDRLAQWRATTAKGLGVPAFGVLTNRALAGLASMRPTSEAELMDVPGVGRTTVARYGVALRSVISGSDVASGVDDTELGAEKPIKDGEHATH